MPKYLLYKSVLKALRKIFDTLMWSERHWEKAADSLSETSPLREVWASFVGALKGKLFIYDLGDDGFFRSYESCGNCSKIDEYGSFKRCGGCSDVRYCSPECQKQDWNQGGHRDYCKKIQECSQRNASTTDEPEFKISKQMLVYDISNVFNQQPEKFDLAPSSGLSILTFSIDYCSPSPNSRLTVEPGCCEHHTRPHKLVKDGETLHIIEVHATIPRGGGTRHLTRSILWDDLKKGSEEFWADLGDPEDNASDGDSEGESLWGRSMTRKMWRKSRGI